jgi:glycosyltransferase involved in cell wall biosynthesis
MKNKKKKICICSDSPQVISGLGKTALRIAKGFYDTGNYDVTYFVITGRDSDLSCSSIYDNSYSDLFDNLTIYNCQLMDQNKFKLFDDYVLKESPDIVLSLLDPWNLDQIELSCYRNTYYWIAYQLFETPEYPEYGMSASPLKFLEPRKSLFDPLRNADLCIPVTKMGKTIFENHNVNSTDNIYLGIDYNSRCVDNKVTKESLFGSKYKDDFIFMTVGKNSERKKLDKIIESFALFMSKSRKQGKYKLYIHTDPNESVTGTDLISLASNLGIIDHILWPSTILNRTIMTDSDLYKRYKVCDAYISLSGGEGLCYPLIEAMMHNKPVIYLNYGGHSEFCSKSGVGYPVRVESYHNARNVSMKWAIADIKDAARQMDYIVDSLSLTQIKHESDEYVNKNFDWDKVIMPKLINEIEANFIQKDKISFNLSRVI